MSCFVCGNQAINLCSKCHQVYYCSRECQRDDWSIHKHNCKTYVASTPIFTLFDRAIGDEIKNAVAQGNVEITITEKWEEFSTNLYHPHFAHIKLIESKHKSTHNVCEIKFDDFVVAKCYYVSGAKFVEMKEGEINSVYFECGV